MPELHEAPVPEDDLYLIWDAKQSRGWWTGGGGYSIWPYAAKIYTAGEVNKICERSSAYIAVFTVSELENSCALFIATVKTMRAGMEAAARRGAT